jgi:nitrogen regulatory protein P-II 1
MKLVTAVIKPHRLDDVVAAIKALGVSGITATEVRGFGRQGGHSETYRGTEYKIDFVPKVRIEVLIDSPDLDRLVDAIVETAKTGKIGDGKVWITEVAETIRIRTGERGTDAI